MPKPVCVTFGLMQFGAIWTSRHHHKQATKNSKHVRTLNIKKEQGQHLNVKILTLTHKCINKTGRNYLPELISSQTKVGEV